MGQGSELDAQGRIASMLSTVYTGRVSQSILARPTASNRVTHDDIQRI